MRKIFYLSTCDTCERIIAELNLGDEFDYHDVKKDPITEAELEKLKEEVGSYEQLFNKRAKLYKERNLAEKYLKDEEYKALILEHYTFLRRPIIVLGDRVIVGNATKVIRETRKYLENNLYER